MKQRNSVNYDNVKIPSADMKNANMYGLSCRNADFSNANFNSALLSLVNFSSANLSNANFKNAIMIGTVFNDETDLRGADVDGALLLFCVNSEKNPLGSKWLKSKGVKNPEKAVIDHKSFLSNLFLMNNEKLTLFIKELEIAKLLSINRVKKEFTSNPESGTVDLMIVEAIGNLVKVLNEHLDSTKNKDHMNNGKHQFFSPALSKTQIEQSTPYKAMIKRVSDYVAKHARYKPFLNLLQQKEFDQALRQACSYGKKNLVDILLWFVKKEKVPLDLDSISNSNGRTAHHYAAISAAKTNNFDILLALDQFPFETEVYHSRTKDNADKTYTDHLTPELKAKYEHELGELVLKEIGYSK